MEYREKFEEWLTGASFDEATKAELKKLEAEGNEEEIRDRFYRDLEFGTAGLRGVIGAGLNRMNYYTVRRATQGLADYINSLGRAAMGVAIAYDSRHMSPEFAECAALSLAANGIRAYLFDALRPTPELSFAVRYLKCTAGINITASHNPSDYNGYKVYWEDGAQITPPHDSGITEKVLAITDFSALKTMDRAEALASGLLTIIGKEIDDCYIAEVKKQVKSWDAIEKEGRNLKIVYTPLNGTGNVPVRRILSEIGFTNVYVVPEQELPDGDFPTTPYPNPEDPAAYQLALKLAREKDADLILATDPDADRLGVYVKDTKSGEYIPLTGNMSGTLLAEYTISRTKETKGLPEDGVLVKSIVSSNLADAIAAHYGLKLIETLTGFKYIGQEILKMEESGKGTYLFGFEESYGCLIGTYARDKDAVVASMALAEAAAFYKTKGMTLWDAMLQMYERYGCYLEKVTSVTLKGIEGLGKIAAIREALRADPPKEIGGKKVLKLRDYQAGTILDTESGTIAPSGLPKSNVLYYDFAGGEWLCVRPSGTEPKIKLYFGVCAENIEKAGEEADAFAKEALRLLEG
ncbi:MAG: phospho-sugar mutase [Lachnospiraceae bacterium]|nr:phospho-sugar mutase [Lachnospiraceae bacterium]